MLLIFFFFFFAVTLVKGHYKSYIDLLMVYMAMIYHLQVLYHTSNLVSGTVPEIFLVASGKIFLSKIL